MSNRWILDGTPHGDDIMELQTITAELQHDLPRAF
jgi:hypothetical protein